MNYLSPRIFRLFLLSASMASPLAAADAQVASLDPAVANILPEGAFDTRTGQFFTGWKTGGFLGGVPGEARMWNNSVTMEADDAGSGFTRISVKEIQGASIGVSQIEPLVLNPAWKTLNLNVSVRVADYSKVADWGGICQFSLIFKNDKDQPISGEFKTGISRNTNGWEELASTFTIPEGAASMAVEIHFMGAMGVVDIKNLRIFADIPATTEPHR